MRDGPAALSADAFRSLYGRLRRELPWDPGDRRGALNNITPERVTAPASEVRTGRTVSL